MPLCVYNVMSRQDPKLPIHMEKNNTRQLNPCTIWVAKTIKDQIYLRSNRKCWLYEFYHLSQYKGSLGNGNGNLNGKRWILLISMDYV